MAFFKTMVGGMFMIEIVVDGTDGSGKTLCVDKLKTHFISLNYKVVTFSPYREREVYYLWENTPVKAAEIIVDIINNFRKENKSNDLIIWDRGWPTAFVTTNNQDALSLFYPFPHITILLLNSEKRTIEKTFKNGVKGIWVKEPHLIHKYNTAYYNLSIDKSVCLIKFYSDKSDMFCYSEICHATEKIVQKLMY